MRLGTNEVEEVHQIVYDGRQGLLDDVSVVSLTLGGAMQLAVCALAWGAADGAAQAWMSHLSRRFGVLRAAISAFRSGTVVGSTGMTDPFSAPEWELYQISTDLTETAWGLYLQRFSRSLIQRANFDRIYARGLAGAFGEMAVNVVQHSAPEGLPAAFGLAGYHVTDAGAAFVVVDSGRGALASLHESPRWRRLSSSEEALSAIVHEEATRKIAYGYGDGFRQVFASLVENNGRVRLRSGDAVVEAANTHAARTFETSFGAPIPGMIVQTLCARGGEPVEQTLEERNPP